MKNWTTTEMAIGGLALVGGLALFNRYGRDTIGLAPATPTSPPDDDMDNFVNMIPAPTCWSNCANGAQAIYSPGGCPPSHPLTQAPMCAPPPPPHRHHHTAATAPTHTASGASCAGPRPCRSPPPPPVSFSRPRRPTPLVCDLSSDFCPSELFDRLPPKIDVL